MRVQLRICIDGCAQEAEAPPQAMMHDRAASPDRGGGDETMNQKTLGIVGWIATCTAMLMYIAYFPQIIHNLHGDKSGFLQPLVAAIAPYGSATGFSRRRRTGLLS